MRTKYACDNQTWDTHKCHQNTCIHREKYASRTSCGCRRRCRGPRGSFAAPYPSSWSGTASLSMWKLKKVVRQSHQYIEWQIEVYPLCRKFNLTFNSSNFHLQPSTASKAMAERKSIHISIVDIFRRKAKTAHRQGSNGTLAWKAKRRINIVKNYFAKQRERQVRDLSTQVE